MTSTKLNVWFWQRIVSPHMAGLAVALARQGHRVVYVAEQAMSEDRQRLGWTMPELGSASLEFASTPEQMNCLVSAAPPASIHLCQGLRGNGLINHAQQALASRQLRQWAVMETVKDTGWRGLPKRIAYRHIFSRRRNELEGLLAIGHRTTDWAAARGMTRARTYPFAYFLAENAIPMEYKTTDIEPFRLIFVGQLNDGKRLDLLLDSIREIDTRSVMLTVVGSGPLQDTLRHQAQSSLEDRLTWLGQLPMREVPMAIAQADCLVLPSQHDGWGAVISEALMVGTPVICSDACGAAGVVEASGVGGVFSKGDKAGLTRLLVETMKLGRLSLVQRRKLAAWAKCLGAEAGATYLSEILTHRESGRPQPTPPWMAGGNYDDISNAAVRAEESHIVSARSSDERSGRTGV